MLAMPLPVSLEVEHAHLVAWTSLQVEHNTKYFQNTRQAEETHSKSVNCRAFVAAICKAA